jgi:hypothetical protein
MADKANAEKAHFKKRVKERYGIFVNKELYHTIVSQCTERRNFIGNQSWNKRIVKVTVNDTSFPVIFDIKRNTPITCLEENWLEDKEILDAVDKKENYA